MKLTDYLRLGWEQLKRRVVVTALCTMGIAIGSASIVVALSFGESINHYSQVQMSYYLQSDEITVRSGQPVGDNTKDPNASKPYALTKAKLAMMRSFPYVKAIASYQTLNQFEFKVDNKAGFINNIYATELDTLKDFGYEFQQGGPSDQENTILLSYGATMSLLDEQANKNRQLQRRSQPNDLEAEESWKEQMLIAYPTYQKQILLSPRVYVPNGPERIGTAIPLRVVGILKKPAGMPDEVVQNQKTAFVSPALGKKLQDAIALTSGGQAPKAENEAIGSDYNEVKIKVTDSLHIKELEPLLKKLKLTVETNLHREEQMKDQLAIVRLVFGGAGVFILFVASISIIVAMTMSTYQRRRQIGIMKVLGANLRQIRSMFMVESALLGLLGGVAGILLSYWVIWGINLVIQKFSPPRPGSDQEILFISLWILPLGLFFAVMTGVLSGIYPAIKASKTDALTTIKRD
jgi:ABC-type antimicrobial peptide transport system permease subunit